MKPRIELLHGDCLEQLEKLSDNSIEALVTDPPAGIGFMGKAWDSDRGGRREWVAWLTTVMVACLRVLKPGGHALVWAIPRTSHWTATAIEDAGFEVRDVVTHLFGQGFPKSLDVSKAIDKAAPDGVRDGGETWGNEVKRDPYLRAAVTDAAREWSGWGTALKPAAEFWILARKPISEKNVSVNVLKWGTGALNIDGCRIEGGGPKGEGGRLAGATGGKSQFNGGRHNPVNDSQGRFPANLVLSCACPTDQHEIDCAVAVLDAQSGELKSGAHVGKTGGKAFGGGRSYESFRDPSQGGASRFFYCAKTAPGERNAGVAGVAGVGALRDNGRKSKPRANHHPTVKPVKLMRYLCRLVTPPGGTVLDPFTGSGTTGIAAIAEGFRFIGIEREREYLRIAKQRLKHAAKTR